MSLLYTILTEGGEPHEIRQDPIEEAGTRFNTLTWTPDDQALLRGAHENSVLRFPLDGGEPEDLGLIYDGSIKGLQVHPDGHSLYFSGVRLTDQIWMLENFLPAAGEP